MKLKIIEFANILKKKIKKTLFIEKTLLLFLNNIINNILKSKKQAFIRLKLIAEYKLIFKILKKKLYSISILVFLNFEYSFILYYNNSKKHKYSITLY